MIKVVASLQCKGNMICYNLGEYKKCLQKRIYIYFIQGNDNDKKNNELQKGSYKVNSLNKMMINNIIIII